MSLFSTSTYLYTMLIVLGLGILYYLVIGVRLQPPASYLSPEQHKVVQEKIKKAIVASTFGLLAGLATFVIILTTMVTLTPIATTFSAVGALLISLIFGAAFSRAVAAKDPMERRRVVIGLGGVVVLYACLYLLNRDLFIGDVGLQNLRPWSEQLTWSTLCTPPEQVSKGYISLEPCPAK